MTTLIKEYKNNKSYQKEANHLEKQGYKVISTTEKHHKMGCIRFFLGGFLFGRRKTTLIVTYEKS